MIDFATLQGLTIPEGIVSQITDASGRILWSSGKPAVLEVAKQILNTTAGETTYENEEFILLDIYPKTNRTVKVTYGGVTKTITDTSGAERPNAQQVFFGTFNGVSDSVTTPASGVLTIEGGYYAFGCGYLSSGTKSNVVCTCINKVLNFGDVDYIPHSAFCNCTNLTSIVFPDSVTNIDNSVFYGCSSLTNIVIPDSVTSIGLYVFYGCSSLESIEIPDSVTSIDKCAFEGCTSLTSIVIPDSVTSIGNYAFRNCDSLTSVVIPDSVTSIGDSAFISCDNLTSILIPDSVTFIGSSAFQGCTSLTSIVIPDSVTFIGIYAFYCYQQKNSVGIVLNHTNVKMLGTIPPELEQDQDADAFDSKMWKFMGTITVPKGCGEIYKNAPGWSYRAEQIVEAS